MLLCGSFQNQIIRLIHMLRFDEKLLSRMSKSMEEKIGGGVHELDEELDDNFDEELDHELDDDLNHELDEESDELDGESDTGVSLAEASYENQTENEELLDSSKAKENSSGRRARTGWRRVREIYKRSKQYVFVAATLPKSGKKTAGGVLKKMFPDATWVNGAHLHRHNPRYATSEPSVLHQVNVLFFLNWQAKRRQVNVLILLFAYLWVCLSFLASQIRAEMDRGDS